MKKKILFGFVLLISVLFIATLIIPGKMGKIVYETVTDLEASLYGFEQVQVDIGEMKITLYKNELTERPTIVMIHGYSADKDNWPRFARYFSEEFNIVIPDMAGHGDTGFDPSWDFSTPSQAKRVALIIQKLNIKKIHIVGNSMGGSIAAHFVRMYPHLTLSATLIDPSGVYSPQPSKMDLMVAQGNNPFIINNREEFDAFYAMTMQQPPFIPDFIFAAISEKYQQRSKQLTQIFKEIDGRDLLDDSLQDVTAPTLLMWGQKDQLIHVSSIETWKKKIKHIKVKVWQGIGHMPMLEIPQQSAEVYRNFLEGIE